MRDQFITVTDAGKEWAITWHPTHQRPGDLTVEFYDLTYPLRDVPNTRAMRGQFVSSYYYSTLAQVLGDGVGINLDGGVPEWNVTADTVSLVVAAIRA